MTCETVACSNCAKWVRERVRVYGDGTRITYYVAPDGKGHCGALAVDTVPEFGCLKFAEAAAFSHVTVEHIDGAPWERWAFIPCPDCNGVGSSNDRACRRCAGTAKVRRYDDGYVADATWDHPLEKERKKAHQEAERRRALEGTSLASIPAPKDGAMAQTGDLP